MKIHTKSIIAVLMLIGLSACAPKDYSKFESGVITPEKLASYVDNWQATKPKGTKGRLVIFKRAQHHWVNLLSTMIKMLVFTKSRAADHVILLTNAMTVLPTFQAPYSQDLMLMA